MTSLPNDHPLRRLFAGTVQHVFYADIGMCDPQIADYLIELLSHLIHMDDLYPFRDAKGRRLQNLAEMVAESHFEGRVPPRVRERTVHRHIGDFALFWTGLFPEALGRLRRFGRGEGLDTYLEMGKRSYAIASGLTRPEDEPPAGVLQRLSDRFEFCVYGLHLCREEWGTLGEPLPPA